MIEFKDVSFRYQESEQANSLCHIDLQIPDGQVVLLCGRFGCGKTSLTRLVNGLIPHYFEGELSGEVLLRGKNIAEQPIYETARSVGSVFQNPRSQFFNVDSTGEVVFGCENMGWPAEKIDDRLAQITREWSLALLLGRNLFHLSDGEKQKIACASVTMYDHEVMVLDEPTSNLDVRSIRMLADIIRAWKASGKTVLVAEHRLHYLASIADRVIYMEDGQIAADMPAREFFRKPPQGIERMGLRALAAVASEKELLVSDEPTSGLDYLHMMEAAEKIRYLSSLGKTIFLITHDPELIAACCNFFLFFERRRIQWSGGATPENCEKLRDFFVTEGK